MGPLLSELWTEATPSSVASQGHFIRTNEDITGNNVQRHSPSGGKQVPFSRTWDECSELVFNVEMKLR